MISTPSLRCAFTLGLILHLVDGHFIPQRWVVSRCYCPNLGLKFDRKNTKPTYPGRHTPFDCRADAISKQSIVSIYVRVNRITKFVRWP